MTNTKQEAKNGEVVVEEKMIKKGKKHENKESTEEKKKTLTRYERAITTYSSKF